jgi:hypothetical protein
MNKIIFLIGGFILSSMLSFGQFNLEVYYENNQFVNPQVLSEPFINETENIYIGDVIDTTYYWDGNDTLPHYVRESYSESDQELITADFQCQHSFGIGAGFSFHKYFDLGLSYHVLEFKKTETIQSTYREAYYDYDDFEGSYMELNDLKFDIKTFSSSFSFKYPLGDFVPEVFIGANIYFTEIDHLYKSEFYFLWADEYWVTDTAHILKNYSGVGFGFQSGLGLTYYLSDNIGVFTKFAFSTGALRISKGELREDTENGVDMYDEMPHELYKSQLPFRMISYDNYSFRFGIEYKF